MEKNINRQRQFYRNYLSECRNSNPGDVVTYVDKDNRFFEYFNKSNGHYGRTDVVDNGGNFTGKDPFMRNYPQLLDIGIMGSKCKCAHRCNVDCYQKAIDRTNGKDMTVEDYRSIMEQSKGKLFSVALGGSGDVDTHDCFEEILDISHEYGVIPSFTTSGILMTLEKARICKEKCGAVAVSEHFADYTNKALDMLLEAGVKTNIHYVLSTESIKTATERILNNSWKDGVNAIVFLTYKPVGLGSEDKVLRANNPDVIEFMNAIDWYMEKMNGLHKKEVDGTITEDEVIWLKRAPLIGFDSCTIPGLLNFTKNIPRELVDSCEGGRFSAYITADMKLLPCSFDNQDERWAVDLRTHSIKEAWDSDTFENFRYSMRHSCSNCSEREFCMGGCPIVPQITLCSRKERDFKQED